MSTLNKARKADLLTLPDDIDIVVPQSSRIIDLIMNIKCIFDDLLNISFIIWRILVFIKQNII